MIDPAVHAWLAANPDKLTPMVKAKIRVNFPADPAKVIEPTTNYVETVADIRDWIKRTYPGTLALEYDL